MAEQWKAGLIGCGDYLRWEIDDLNNSKFLKVKSTFDIDTQKSSAVAAKINASSVPSVDDIFVDEEIKIVLIFTPPWVRKELFSKAVKAGKHIITTKPFGSNLADAQELQLIVDGNVQCAVFYGRAGNPAIETLKKVLDSGEIGKLGMYKEDWLHHYPTWNDWATDPEKNGGPFMDAMVHNLNKARYLSGAKAAGVNYFSENYAQSLKCNDTESMKLDFENGAASYLFITWAADLEVFDPSGNDRVHLGIEHIITNKGWYVTVEEQDGKEVVKAVKEKETKTWPVEALPQTKYDVFSEAVQDGKPIEHDVSIAVEDMRIMDIAVKNKTKPVTL